MFKHLTKTIVTSLAVTTLFTSTVFADGVTTGIRPSVTYSEQLEYFNNFVKQTPSENKTPSGNKTPSENKTPEVPSENEVPIIEPEEPAGNETPSENEVPEEDHSPVEVEDPITPTVPAEAPPIVGETVTTTSYSTKSAETSSGVASGYLNVDVYTPPTYVDENLWKGGEIPSQYKTSNITAPRRQTGDGPCWAYSEAGALEQSAIVHQGASSSIVVDEEYIQSCLINPPAAKFNLTAGDTTIRSTTDPGGNQILSVWELASGCVPTLKGSTTPAYTPVECRFININESDNIKRAIMENGAVEIGVQFDPANESDYKYKSSSTLNHSILLLGWDDTISASAFTAGSGATPTKSGAWYFKDSGGFTSSGFGWLSYDDAAMRNTDYNRAFTTKLAAYPKADNLYQYDGTFSYKVCEGKSFTNIFKMQSGTSTEIIKAVGIGSATIGSITLKVEAYNNETGSGTPIASTTQDISFNNWGYKVIDLETPLTVPADSFVFVSVYHKSGSTIYICIDTPMIFGGSSEYIEFRPTAKDGQFLIDGKSYSTIGNKTPRIKLYTDNGNDSRTDISSAKVTLDSTPIVFDGTAKKPAVTSVVLGSTTIPSSEYTVTYSNNTNAGTATATVTIKSSSATYRGSANATFNISTANLDSTVMSSAVTALIGTTHENVGKKAVITLGGYTLKYGTDFVATQPNSVVAADTSEVPITGLKNFTGSRAVRVTSSATTIDITKATVEPIPDQTYTGSPITLSEKDLVVKYNGSVLKLTNDYITTYLNNTDVGTATVNIVGAGLYTGTKAVTFNIKSSVQPDPPSPQPSAKHPPLSESEITLAKGKTKTLKVPDAKYSIVWSMTAPEVAKVSTKGKVTALTPGVCYIYAYTNNTLYAPCKVTVTE